MKIFTNKNLIQKAAISILCVVVLINFCMAPKVEASWGGDLMGVMRDFVTAIADVSISIVQFGLTGEWHYAVDKKGSGNPDQTDSYFIEAKKFQYPVIQISPELIFADKIEILNVDFISSPRTDYTIKAGNTEGITKLRTIIASWYVTLRTIAVVGLLSVLIYIGIRIIISSTSQDKAKYKQRLMDWIIAFCLLFFMHYIMAAAVNVIGKVNDVLAEAVHINSGLDLMADYGGVEYRDEANLGVSAGGQTGAIMELITGENTDASKIQAVRDILTGKGYTIESEGSWEYKGSRTEWLITTIATYEYTITCSDGVSATIVKEESTTSDPTGAGMPAVTNSYKYSLIEPADNGSGDTIGTNGAGLYTASDKNKVLYFINYARMYLEVSAEDQYLPMSVGFLIIYIILIVFTGMFAIRYMKRVIYIAFLTMIAPVVALTYPLDKIKDRKSTSI